MGIVLLLSLSGSIALGGGILFQRLMKRFSPGGRQDLWLKVTLALYLISASAAAGIKYAAKKLHITDQGGSVFISHNKANILRYNGRFAVNRVFAAYAAITLVIAAVMMILFMKKLLDYRKVKRAVMSGGLYKKADIPAEEIEKLKKMIHLKKAVQIYSTDMETGAFTLGYVHPIIVLRNEPEREKREVILLHELCHIKRGDAFFKLIGMAAVCVHWFNPLVYCLPGLINRSCELNCDEMVLGHLSMKQRIIYVREIVSQAGAVRKEGDLLMRLGAKESLTEERVVNILNNERKKKSKTAACLTGVLTAVMVMVSCVPVWAYDGVQVFELYGEEEFVRREAERFSESDIAFTTDEDFFYEPVMDIRYDQQFVDEDGNIYEVSLGKNGRAGCTHSSLVSGTYTNHIKNSSGGCVVETYSAKRCNSCGATFTESLISKYEYVVCPH